MCSRILASSLLRREPSSFRSEICTTLTSWCGSHIEEMWDEGERTSWSSDVVAGVQHFLPSAHTSLAVSWSLIHAWNRRELPCRALPLTPELTAALAGGFLHAGFPLLAGGIVVGFDTLNLVVEDVLVDASSGFAGMLRFRETKAGARHDRQSDCAWRPPLSLKGSWTRV